MALTPHTVVPDDAASTASTVTPAEGRDATTYAGYLMVGHSDETHEIHAMLSEGTDPTRWTALNDGRGIVTSTMGEKGIRDPHLVRAPDGTYYLLGTDLDIRRTERPGIQGDFWDWLGRHGSRSINVWESTDLVTWSPQRQVEISPPTAGMAWAPKTVWDDAADAFLLIWSARMYAADDVDHERDGVHRLLACHTRDFRTFTEPVDWGHPTRSTIDALVIAVDAAGNAVAPSRPPAVGQVSYLRFVKDEAAGVVFAERSANLHATDWEPVSGSVTAGTDTGIVEGPLAFQSFTDGEWYLWVDEYTGADRGYLPFHAASPGVERWDPVQGHLFPGKVKHGTVIPLTAAEYARLGG